MNIKKTFGIFMFVVLTLSTASAIDFGFPKATTCNVFNLTGGACDLFWCESVQEGNYSTAREICIFTEVINETIIVNKTFIPENSLSTTEFLNKTEIAESHYNKTESDKKFNEFKINFTGLFARADDLSDLKSKVTALSNKSVLGNIDTGDILIIVIVVALGFVGLNQYSKRQQLKTPLEKGHAQTVQKKIQSPRERELEQQLYESQQKQELPKKESVDKKLEDIEKLKKEIAELEEKLKAGKE